MRRTAIIPGSTARRGRVGNINMAGLRRGEMSIEEFDSLLYASKTHTPWHPHHFKCTWWGKRVCNCVEGKEKKK